jgi:hypothetical protein
MATGCGEHQQLIKASLKAILMSSRILGSSVALSQLMLSGKGLNNGHEVLLAAGLPELYVPTLERISRKENSVLDGLIRPSPGKDVKAKL